MVNQIALEVQKIFCGEFKCNLYYDRKLYYRNISGASEGFPYNAVTLRSVC
jgi:hypothetical protein